MIAHAKMLLIRLDSLTHQRQRLQSRKRQQSMRAIITELLDAELEADEEQDDAIPERMVTHPTQQFAACDPRRYRRLA